MKIILIIISIMIAILISCTCNDKGVGANFILASQDQTCIIMKDVSHEAVTYGDFIICPKDKFKQVIAIESVDLRARLLESIK